MKTPGQGRARGAQPTSGSIDGPTAVRAASTGLTVLVLGGLVAPIAAAYLPVIGQFWLSLVAVVAFAIAGSRVGTARATHLQGACAALGSYLLVLPLVLWLPTGRTGVGVAQVLMTAMAAVAVGAIAGILAGRRRDAPAAGA